MYNELYPLFSGDHLTIFLQDTVLPTRDGNLTIKIYFTDESYTGEIDLASLIKFFEDTLDAIKLKFQPLKCEALKCPNLKQVQ